MGILDNLTGGSSRRDIREGRRRARQNILQGRDTGQGYYDRGYEESMGYLQPYIESGQRGQQYYDDLIGLNGEEARTAAQNLLRSDDAYQGQLGQEQNAMLRSMNARGMSGSGAGALAAERVFQGNYGNTLNRYAQRGQQGFQAAGAGANMASQYANNSANLQYGAMSQIAQNNITSQNAIANSRNTGMNNLLNLAGAGINGYNAMYNGGGGKS